MGKNYVTIIITVEIVRNFWNAFPNNNSNFTTDSQILTSLRVENRSKLECIKYKQAYFRLQFLFL